MAFSGAFWKAVASRRNQTSHPTADPHSPSDLPACPHLPPASLRSPVSLDTFPPVVLATPCIGWNFGIDWPGGSLSTRKLSAVLLKCITRTPRMQLSPEGAHWLTSEVSRCMGITWRSGRNPAAPSWPESGRMRRSLDDQCILGPLGEVGRFQLHRPESRCVSVCDCLCLCEPLFFGSFRSGRDTGLSRTGIIKSSLACSVV